MSLAGKGSSEEWWSTLFGIDAKQRVIPMFHISDYTFMFHY